MSSVISAENLSKEYNIGHRKQERYTALRDVLANSAKRINRKLLHLFSEQQNDPTHEEFWALKDISFNATTNCSQLKMQLVDGKMHQMSVK